MATYRNVILANEEIYHVFNRGVERRTIFTTKWEYQRALELLKYYCFSDLPARFSQVMRLPKDEKDQMLWDINKNNEKLVEIIAFCLMPNHFHFILKQVKDNGIKIFISNFTNAYTKYFNTKHERTGSLVEGIFKAVRVETDEQLIHLSRYIHLNPVSSFIIPTADLENYPWSSLHQYLEANNDDFCSKEIILGLFPSHQDYKKFVFDQIAYAQELEKIKHLAIE